MADDGKKDQREDEKTLADPMKETSEYDETIIQGEPKVQVGSPKEDLPHLVIVQGPHQGLQFPLGKGDNTIGRVMGSEVLLEDQSVSRRHAIVTQAREGFTVEDLGSKNGTLVNGQKITEKVTIGHGDVIAVGIYTLRLFTKKGSPEEESLPPDWEGRTVMFDSKPEEETKTMTEEEKKETAPAGEVGEEAAPDGTKEIPIPEEEVTEERRRRISKWLVLVLAGVVVVALLAAGGVYTYWKFFPAPTKLVEPAKSPSAGPLAEPGRPASPQGPGSVPTEPGAPMTAEPPKAPLASIIPVFLDFASSPLPAAVTFQGKDYGLAPIKVQMTLDVDKEYTAEAVFELREIGETYKTDSVFTVKREEPLIPILFKAPIGVLKIMELPKEVDLYLEGYFIYDPFNAKASKLTDVVFGKPVYIPFGKYVVELRKEKEVAGSGEFIKDIRYRREILVSEDSPVYEIKITDQDLNEFPVEVVSIPLNADVFVDAAKVGKTPYKGIFPLGEHVLSLRKDGYFEYKQDLKMDKNTPVKIEIPLKTTVSGEFIVAGQHLMQKGLYKEAIDKLTEVFTHNPTEGETAQTRYLLGSCFVHLGDLGTAEGYFKQSVENAEMRHPSLLGLVSVYQGSGRKAEAIPHLVEVLLNAKDEEVIGEAKALFQQISPLHSIIYVRTDPVGAKVILNDKPVEQVTPLILPDLGLGNYKLRIEKDGYLPQDLSLNLSVSEFNPVIVQLKPVPQ